MLLTYIQYIQYIAYPIELIPKLQNDMDKLGTL
jgi:hypothetical protein